MTTMIERLFDDFALPTLDRAKWTSTGGAVSIKSPRGLRIGAGAQANFYSDVISANTYDITSSQIAAKITSVVEGGGSGTSGMFLTRDVDQYAFMFVCDGTNLFLQVRASDGTVTVKASVPYSAANHLWWRFREDRNSTSIMWQTSRDGLSWVTRATQDYGGTMVSAMRLVFENGYYDSTKPVTGPMDIEFVNTVSPVNRAGSRPDGYVVENMDGLPVGNLPLNANYGVLNALDTDGTGVQIASSPPGNALRLTSSSTAPAIGSIRLRQTIKNLDMYVNLKHISRIAPTPDADDIVNSPRIFWRVQGDYVHTRYELVQATDALIVNVVVDDVQTNIAYLAIGSDMGVNYRYRIQHVGGTCVISRDGGDFATTGRVSQVGELFRFNDDTITSSGTIAFSAQGCTFDIDNIDVAQSFFIAPERKGRPIRSRRWGIFVGDGPTDTSMVDNPNYLPPVEAMVGRTFDIASWFLGMDRNIPQGAIDFANQGRSNLIAWGPRGVTADSILNAGALDAYLDQMAATIISMPTTTYLRMMWEMNGLWSPWSRDYDSDSGNPTADSMHITSYQQFIDVWRYIVDHLRAAGAGEAKLKFVWCPNVDDVPRTSKMEAYYPGDAYVDVLGFDGYNWGNSADGRTWQTHREVLNLAYDRLCTIHPSKPIWLTETSSKEPTESDGAAIDSAHSKGQWVADLMNDAGLTRIEAVCWFHIVKERDWRVDSSPGSLDAFVAAFSAPLVSGEVIIADPEGDPQPIRQGRPSATLVHQYEYVRLEEGDTAPLLVMPSAGGFWMTTLDLGFPEARENVYVRTAISGTHDRTAQHDGKPVSLGGVVIPYLGIETAYQKDMLARWMRPERRPQLIYKPRGQDERRLLLAPRALVSPTDIVHRRHAEVQMQFVAPDGVAYSTQERYAELSASDLDAAEVVTYGTGVAQPVIRIYGPCTNPIIYNDSAPDAADGGGRLGLAMTLAAGEFVEIDTAARSVQMFGWIDSSASVRDRLDPRRWFGLTPFRNYLRLESDDGTGTADLTWSDAWLL